MNYINVTCAIIYIDNNILAVKRSKKMSNSQKWEFPGGKIELNEDEITCIKREIREELGIEIEVKERLESITHIYGEYSINLIPFKAKYLSGTIELKEHIDYKLLKEEELIQLDWSEADRLIVNRLI